MLRKSERTGVELFKAFSLFVNFKLLCKMSGNKKSPNVIHCLNGIRCLSIVWIVFGHCYMVVLLLPTNVNSAEILDWLRTPFSMFLQSGTMSVDSFFFLSGFLLSWVAFKELEKSYVFHCHKCHLILFLPFQKRKAEYSYDVSPSVYPLDPSRCHLHVVLC